MWIEKRENNKGTRFVYYERYKDPNTGEQFKVNVTLSSDSSHAKKEAARMLHERISLKKEKAKEDQFISFGQVALDWAEYARPMVKPPTAANHNIHNRKILSYIPSKTRLIDVTPIMIEDFINGVYYRENRSYSYAKSLLSQVKCIFRYAKRKRLIKDISDLEELRVTRKPFTEEDIRKKQNKFLDREELRSVLSQLERINPRLSLAMEFLSLTGLRCGEMLALRVCDYDKAAATININGTLRHNVQNEKGEKRGTPKNIYSVRDVALNSRAAAILDRFILENKKSSLWGSGYKDQGYIFTTNRGAPYNIQFIGHQLRKLHIKDKIITTHIFRHTHISILAELGIPLKVIMQRVGHNDPATTLSIYTHVTTATKDESLKKLEAYTL